MNYAVKVQIKPAPPPQRAFAGGDQRAKPLHATSIIHELPNPVDNTHPKYEK